MKFAILVSLALLDQTFTDPAQKPGSLHARLLDANGSVLQETDFAADATNPALAVTSFTVDTEGSYVVSTSLRDANTNVDLTTPVAASIDVKATIPVPPVGVTVKVPGTLTLSVTQTE